MNPKAGTARVVGHLPEAVSHANALVLGGSIYVLGGEAGGTPSDRIWRFEPGHVNVVAAGRLPRPIAGGSAAMIGSTGYLIGGTGPGETPLATVVTLSPERLTKPKPAGAPARSLRSPAA